MRISLDELCKLRDETNARMFRSAVRGRDDYGVDDVLNLPRPLSETIPIALQLLDDAARSELAKAWALRACGRIDGFGPLVESLRSGADVGSEVMDVLAKGPSSWDEARWAAARYVFAVAKYRTDRHAAAEVAMFCQSMNPYEAAMQAKEIACASERTVTEPKQETATP